MTKKENHDCFTQTGKRSIMHLSACDEGEGDQHTLILTMTHAQAPWFSARKIKNGFVIKIRGDYEVHDFKRFLDDYFKRGVWDMGDDL